MKIKGLTFADSGRGDSASRRSKARPPRMRRHWRVEIINENTLSRTWSMRLSEIKAWIAGGALLAAIISLIAVIVIFTPIRSILSGELPGDLRNRYIEMAIRLDSISERARVSEAYTANILAVLTDSISGDDLKHEVLQKAENGSSTDSLLPASDAEKRFVQQFDSRERYNLSVLSPIAAEGMIFYAPTTSDDGIGNVSAIYRGTVLSLEYASDGLATIIVQHPNDFISVYSNLTDTYTDKGAKLLAGQRIGISTAETPMSFELWHAGTLLDASQYISYQSMK